MKKINFLFILLFSLMGLSQERMIEKSGTVTFDASFPSFDEVKAINNEVTFVLNSKTGEIASLALVKSFDFKTTLMEEHFNENYMESDQYPKAIFRGQIKDFDYKKLTLNHEEYTIKGNLELHGQSKEITIIAQIRKIGKQVIIFSNFTINAIDYGIPIPVLIKYKLANKVNIQFDALLAFDYK